LAQGSRQEGEFYAREVIGLKVRTVEGEELGEVTEILVTGANDVYVVKGERGEILLPARVEVIKGIDVEVGIMTVELLPGL
jgi:16S rRNA processing protein RimM